MVFDSFTFIAFFACFFVAYHLLSRWFRLQNLLALVGSCVFYGAWDVRFLGLLLVSAGIDYLAGLALGLDWPQRRRRLVLAVSMTANLGILFAFKYYDFFAESLLVAMHALGVSAKLSLLHVVLPVGISFYTFQSMSYTIDIYRKEVEPERNPITYFTFVSFFPHMVAGPIQRAHHLLAQLNRPRVIRMDEVLEAVWLLSWGFFLKSVVANGMASFADVAFAADQKSGWTTILGTLAFGGQIYCDFNAYSVIARGLGRLLGIEFIWNFNQPYFATSLQEFWRRWHISLSTWLRDYLYVSLGGNRKGPRRTYVNLFLTMLLGGLWHGAAWNFVFWGALHGGVLAIERFVRGRRGDEAGVHPALGWLTTMTVVFAGWFLFRCRSFEMIAVMLRSLGNMGLDARHGKYALSLAVLAAPVALIEVWQFRAGHLLAPLSSPKLAFVAMTGTMVALTYAMFERFRYGFIYFQF
jgi:D-alanyl-lipoteichoic acid acyltransferase DltB (MBOAT superfamily)